MSVLVPPRNDVVWTPTALGTVFGGYRVYRRPSRAVVPVWELVGDLTVPDGYTAATVEAQHFAFTDFEPGWAGGQWADGWDYTITVVNASTGLESVLATADTRNILTADFDSWVCSSTAPWLNLPAFVEELSGDMLDSFKVYPEILGRGYAMVRSRSGVAARQYRVRFNTLPAQGEERVRPLRAAVFSGRQVALLVPTGDRVLGALGAMKTSIGAGETVQGDLTFVETAARSAVAGYNLPAGLVLNGTSQYVTVPDAVSLNPAGGPFTVVVAGAFGGSGASRAALAKGNLGVADGYGVRSTAVANELQFFVDGAGAAGGPSEVSPVWFDGSVHVAAGTSDGSTQRLYRDGVEVGVAAVAHGAVTNAVALTVGANNGGASGFMATAPVRAWAYYPRVLTSTEITNVSRYLLGYPGWPMPSDAALFADLRDDRTWDGTGTTLVDLSGTGHVPSLVAAPPTRGVPWPLADIEAA